jgi:hypothetical protein
VKKPTFEQLRNNTLKARIPGVRMKDIGILCALYDRIHTTYAIVPQVIEIRMGENKRGVKKEITLYYAAISDNEIGKLQKRYPKETFHAVKDLFSHIKNCISLSVKHKYQGDENKNWSWHRLYREYVNVTK